MPNLWDIFIKWNDIWTGNFSESRYFLVLLDVTSSPYQGFSSPSVPAGYSHLRLSPYQISRRLVIWKSRRNRHCHLHCYQPSFFRSQMRKMRPKSNQSRRHGSHKYSRIHFSQFTFSTFQPLRRYSPFKIIRTFWVTARV